MDLFNIKIEARCRYAGEAYVVIKAIRDAYAWAQQKADEAGDLPTIGEYSKERIEHFNQLLSEAEALLAEEDRLFGMEVAA